MKKLRKMIYALALSASLLLTGCSGLLTSSMSDDGGQQEAWGAQGTQGAQAAQGATSRNEVGNVSQSSTKTPTMDLNGYSLTVNNAVYCLTDNGDMVMISGEYNGTYVLLTFASTTGIQANTSFSQKDFGSTTELGAAIVEPASGVVIADNSQAGISGASVSIKDISNSSMDITLSATLNAYNTAFSLNASGTVTLTDLDTCTKIISEFDGLAATVESSSSSSSGGGQPFTCTGCKGSRKCQYCYGEGSGVCGACLGLLDHCMSCGGTHVCKYCRGSGICHHCNGEGVMY